ncbi:uncharacterized protein PG998_010617 [Apiospora kogelbergensis]|uniref:uncharacterized protein n=1 Tax=Apiospora kogelbergensis TaxID=1337665 RepID=UPI00312E91EC
MSSSALSIIAPHEAVRDIAPDIEDYWPRRLLHISSMTSYERVGANTYNGETCPAYNILSYTWGRWEDYAPTVPRTLPVRGLKWKVPPIMESHFTLAAFHKVVDSMRMNGVEWAWLDVACIDQEDDSIKMDEVGRQASIFKKASKVLTWLSRTSEADLRAAYNVLDEKGPMLWNSNLVEELPAGIIQLLSNALETIFNDPYFSSLWTLQESVLRNDSVALTTSGDPVMTDSGFHLHMFMIMNTCKNIYTQLSRILQGMEAALYDEPIRHIIYNMTTKLQQTGYSYTFATNPNLQYAIAKHRKTTREEDRVYAIMQVYNIRVGQALRGNEHPTLDSLVQEFGLALNKRSPLLGQLFLHASEPRDGLSWCITQDTRVPEAFRLLNMASCSATIREGGGGGGVIATGPCFSLLSWYATMRLLSTTGHRLLRELRLCIWTIT